MSLDVDIVTGKPKEHVEEKKDEKVEQLRKVAGEGDVLEREFKTARGQKFIQIMIETLEQRIFAMMKQDPECQALMRVLEEMKVKVALSRGIAEKIVKGSVI